MVFLYLFYFSGLVIVALILAKMMEERTRRRFFLLHAVSRGDAHVRDLYHRGVHLYTEWKGKSHHFITKHLPNHSKVALNKSISYTRGVVEKYVGDVRNSRLLKRDDGISEFFRNVADIEKGSGEINDFLDDDSQKDESEVK